MKKILIVEDEAAIRLLLEYDLESSEYELTFANDGQQALKFLYNNEFDLALVDWMLPFKSGIELISEVRQFNQQIKLIMLTAKDNELDIVQGLEAGADDYLTKPFSSRELKARIRAHLRNNVKNSIMKVHHLEINLLKREVLSFQEKIELSKIEYELLLYLIKNKNIVLSRDKILETVWDNNGDYFDIRLVDTYISVLKKKLDLKDYLITKRGVGYVFLG